MGRRALVGTAVATAALVVAAVALASGSNRQVQMLDNCDGASFNAVIGPGTCVRSGGTTFDRFIDQLVTQGRAPAWRFASDRLSLPAGGTIEAVNRGGEFHTFTEVAAFGGGCIPVLNAILGLTAVPECAVPGIFGATGAEPGESVTTGPLSAGTHRFMCLLHPWMKTTAEVR